ncbi:MAG: hypothetical protein QMD43_00470 [Thermodesulfovibrio sp.]|uniref:hypothetical protein n=1 Tax=unclassified Thermodesulfovibrio TaxID=2645936 RepID=UPI00083A8745|nr:MULTISPECIES: hypothetical protein [unclassified Thermodesulfovibrio]MDI1472784.1 hypothetical protein [Thermodesulfovibrio sp. 1176]MDI6713483.1 hypothetical protein [Thermodesulfovibrio sp.]ODA44571.1 hypothetical protein THER_0719 [Thermodesulfovibrio sp. N1]
MHLKEILLLIFIMFMTTTVSAFDCGYNGYRGCANADIEQIGAFNQADIETSGMNRVTIRQEGIKNIANIKQSFALFGNNAEILQYGSHNSVFQNQTGLNNYIYVEQLGTFNVSNQIQKGNNNIASAIQFGIGNTISQTQYTSHNLALALQIGFYNKAYQIQGLTGTNGNKSNLHQIGFGVLTIIIQ